jgi:hypothetical protein
MRLPRILAAAMVLALGLAPAPARADIAVTGAASPAAADQVRMLIPAMESWIDAHSDLPRSARPLRRVAFVAPGSEVTYHGRSTQLGSTIRGVYDAQTATIHLVKPWFGTTAFDRSVLLHELVHHRQVDARHWYCDRAMEWDAYKLQDRFLAQSGVESGFYWPAILLQSSCAVRDHHPD